MNINPTIRTEKRAGLLKNSDAIVAVEIKDLGWTFIYTAYFEADSPQPIPLMMNILVAIAILGSVFYVCEKIILVQPATRD